MKVKFSSAHIENVDNGFLLNIFYRNEAERLHSTRTFYESHEKCLHKIADFILNELEQIKNGESKSEYGIEVRNE